MKFDQKHTHLFKMIEHYFDMKIDDLKKEGVFDFVLNLDNYGVVQKALLKAYDKDKTKTQMARHFTNYLKVVLRKK